MRVLVLTQAYPSKENIMPMAFVHTRLKYYMQNGLDVDVLNFSAKSNYVHEGVKVYTCAPRNIAEYDVVVSHAPNLRSHLLFLLPRMRQIKKLVFIFHGHEILYITSYTSAPFSKIKPKLYCVYNLFQKLYDKVKLFVLRKFIQKHLRGKLSLIFVSKWLYNQFLLNVGLKESELTGRYQIIHNCVGESFISNRYTPENAKYDFICIRGFDRAIYCIDVVVKLAEQNPHLKFHIYGKGRYFEYYKKPSNITIFEKYIPNSEIPNLLNNYKAAIMPSRLDSQGVMVSEMATYGIPVISSNIEVSRDMFKEFPNVFFINNDAPKLPSNMDVNIINPVKKFYSEQTVLKEIEWIKNS
ncbi:MAG: hypothetical protein K0R73_476 [Candidatus Midichloriaceae bacterium]|jgi:glycosyltransferase involved in cell wall biosynthesis|nr:hypothetical protein [Candidatus Midichloriaceae bacterium]